MEQPKGYKVPGKKNKVYILTKSLYGLNQALKQWHENFDNTFIDNGYSINDYNRCVYIKFEQRIGIFICMYVDDMLIIGTSLDIVKSAGCQQKFYFVTRLTHIDFRFGSLKGQVWLCL